MGSKGKNRMSARGQGIMGTKKTKGRTSIWTDELVAQLLKLWEEGLSAADIAQQLGHGLSRNAVIGKIHRLRAAGKAPASRKNDSASRKRPAPKPRRQADAPAATARTAGSGALAAQPVQAVATQALELPREETRLRLVELEKGLIQDIMELRHDSCRWPIGNPGEDDFSYCGRKAGEGKPYCEHHAGLAYTGGNPGSRR